MILIYLLVVLCLYACFCVTRNKSSWHTAKVGERGLSRLEKLANRIAFPGIVAYWFSFLVFWFVVGWLTAPFIKQK